MDLLQPNFGRNRATSLGDTTHISPLLRKLFLASDAGLQLPLWLLAVAAKRGASDFAPRLSPALPQDNSSLSNEELAIGLCLNHMPDDPVLICAAAQLLSSTTTDVAKLLWLAKTERTEAVLRYIADACAEVSPEMEPWKTVRERLFPRARAKQGVLPLASSFCKTQLPSKSGLWRRKNETDALPCLATPS
jgi:hypothetical protein